MHGFPAFVVLFSLLLTAAASSTKTLPVYKVKPRHVDEDGAVKLIKQLFDVHKVTTNYTDDQRYIAMSNDRSKSVELDYRSGGVWAADMAELWNTDCKPELINDKKAIEKADDLVSKYDLIPCVKGPMKVSCGTTSGTFVAKESDGCDREEWQVDVSVSYDITLDTPCGEYPIIGGGGRFQLTFGDDGKLIGYHGVWREILEDETTEYDMISQDDANKAFLASAPYISEKLDFNSSIAYYSAPFGVDEDYLYPVYVFEGTVGCGNETMELLRSYVPATTFNLYPSVPTQTIAYDAQPTRAPDPPRLRHRALRPRTNDDGMLESGIEWLGIPYGVPRGQENAQAFQNELGWNAKFDWGNTLVWESDFNRNDDIWADTVDILMFYGHGSADGWMTNTPDVNNVVNTIVGSWPATPGDLWGEQDLEWFIVYACLVLEDTPTSSVFDRWRGAFDGLHAMFGFGTIAYDVPDSGRRIARYALDGDTILDSWFRTAKEIQPSGVIVASLWTSGPGGDSRHDHLHDHGSVSGDNLADEQTRWYMWSVC